MAKIATESKQAEVVAQGEALSATVNFSGALMEMLATVYVYILMSAIREAIQNACDASKRAGLSFSEGVTVLLPTLSNPVITIIDRGSGMTKEFMESPNGYLSFGSSTKAADNNSAGGLGVGRWAAYGYIRECYITTCHESDMVERTYFQYQGDGNKPQVQRASEVPGKQTGTRVFFPVKEHDVEEAYRAVAWLKEVMQLTMGDSFTVDKPQLLPNVLPEYSGVPLELGDVDPGLAGVVVYPMQGSALKYNRQGLQDGSLVVLTNKEAGVGGLPFHVQTPTDAHSVFFKGMVVEIPMSFAIPFMPSREELKYTDDVNHLLKRIDAAAMKAGAAMAERLYSSPSLADKAKLTRLLGANGDTWHAMATSARSTTPSHELFVSATGGVAWQGQVYLPIPPGFWSADLSVRYSHNGDYSLKKVFGEVRQMAVSNGQGGSTRIFFNPVKPVVLVVNDVKTGGTQRFREWLDSLKGNSTSYLLISGSEALEKAELLNAEFGNELSILRTSSFPAAARVIKGKSSVSKLSTRSSLTYYSVSDSKQMQETMSFTSALGSRESRRIWLSKDGGRLFGFDDKITLSNLTSAYGGGLESLLTELGVDRLYLLNPKQTDELLKLKETVDAEGWLDMDETALGGDEDARAAIADAKNVAGWQHFEDALMEFIDTPLVQDALAGRVPIEIQGSYQLTNLCKALAKKPRMELVGTRFDKVISRYVDVLSGTVHVLPTEAAEAKRRYVFNALRTVGNNLEPTEHDSDERKRLIEVARSVYQAGYIDYARAWRELCEMFPLLVAVQSSFDSNNEPVLNDFSCALAAVYR